MRFILSFFFFGFLFYLIYIFFPDAFATLVSWAAHVYEFFRNIVVWIVDQVKDKKIIPTRDTPPPEQTVEAFIRFVRVYL